MCTDPYKNDKPPAERMPRRSCDLLSSRLVSY
jgi:hypothetical protein